MALIVALAVAIIVIWLILVLLAHLTLGNFVLLLLVGVAFLWWHNRKSSHSRNRLWR